MRRPAATATPSPPERRKQSCRSNDSALPGGSARGGRTGGRHLGLNDEQSGSWAVTCERYGTIGHCEHGAGQEAHCRQAVGSEILEIRDDHVDALNMERPRAEVDHDGPIHGRTLNGLRRPETQQRAACAGFGQQLGSTDSIDQGLWKLENGTRGDPDRTSVRFPADEASRAIDRCFGRFPGR